MSLFVTIVILDLTYVSLLFDLRLVDSGGRGGGVPLVFMLSPPPASPGLIRKLGILGRSGLESFSLGLVPAMVFRCSLSLDLMGGGIGRSVLPETAQISFSYVGTQV